MKETRLSVVQQTFEGPFSKSIAVLTVGRNIQQQHAHTGVGQLTGNPQAHGSCADHGGFINLNLKRID